MKFKEFQKTREFRNDLLSYDDEIVEGYIYGDFIANKYINLKQLKRTNWKVCTLMN